MKLTDETLEKLVMIEAQIKDLEQKAKEIKDLCRMTGSFSTDRFLVMVTPVVQTRLESIDAMTKFFGKDALEEAGLIKRVSFSTVRVQKRTPLEAGL